MDKQGYFRLVITGLVKDINYEKNVIRLDNDGEEVNICILSNREINSIRVGEEIKVYIKIRAVSEEMNVLGYLSKEVRDFVAQFECVNGVGAKGAMSIYETLISRGMSMKDICFEISVGNSEIFRDIDGIGSKTVQRILATLKDNIISTEGISDTVSDNPQLVEVVETLKSLGFVQSDINSAIGQLDITSEMQVMDIVQAAIKKVQ